MVPFGTAAIETDQWAAGIDDARLEQAFLQRDDGSVIFRDERVCSGESDGVAVILDDEAASPPANGGLDRASPGTCPDLEEQMRAGLAMCGPWQKVGVRFAGTQVLPFAHNRLPSLRRPGWRRGFEWIEQAHLGRPVMQHAANYIALGDQGMGAARSNAVRS